MGYCVVVDKTIPVARGKVFACLMDFGGVGKLLGDAVASCTVEGSGVGAVRTIRLNGMDGEVVERLECAYEQSVFSYSIIAPCPLPVDYYHAVVTLSDAPGGGTRVVWGSNWLAKGAPEAEVKTMLTGLYENLIGAMGKL
ncbi:MAG: SRPBCC family protein [Gammaproteobacteria bacterium]